MPLRNRVDPFGDLHAVSARGIFTGNRGCLVDDTGKLVRHHRGRLWITCVLEYQDWRKPLNQPGTWTPLFFLDDAVALAAGHRPCGFCRRDDYTDYRSAVAKGADAAGLDASGLNNLLASERLARGRGLDRRGDRKMWRSSPSTLPDGTVLVIGGRAHLLTGSQVQEFSFSGWQPPRPAPDEKVRVLTPPTSVTALANGFELQLHRSAEIQ